MNIHSKYGNPFAKTLGPKFFFAPDKGGESNGSSKKDDEDEEEDAEADEEDADEEEESEEDDSDADEDSEEPESEEDDDKKKKKKKTAQSSKGTLTRAEHEKALVRARKAEKSKQFERIEKLTTDNETLRQNIETLTNAVGKLTTKLDSLKVAKSKDGKTVDVEKLLETAISKTQEKTGKGQDREVAKLQKKLAALETENRQAKSERLRAQLIAEEGGEDVMVVDLVSGETEDEILESIEAAKATFAKVAAKFKGRKRGEDDEDEEEEETEEEEERTVSRSDRRRTSEDRHKSNNEKARRAAPPIVPERGGNPGGNGRESRIPEPLRGVKALSPGEYAEKRGEVLESLKHRYAKPGQGANPFGRSIAGRR